jgi:hypothetical protein
MPHSTTCLPENFDTIYGLNSPQAQQHILEHKNITCNYKGYDQKVKLPKPVVYLYSIFI